MFLVIDPAIHPPNKNDLRHGRNQRMLLVLENRIPRERLCRWITRLQRWVPTDPIEPSNAPEVLAMDTS